MPATRRRARNAIGCEKMIKRKMFDKPAKAYNEKREKKWAQRYRSIFDGGEKYGLEWDRDLAPIREKAWRLDIPDEFSSFIERLCDDVSASIKEQDEGYGRLGKIIALPGDFKSKDRKQWMDEYIWRPNAAYPPAGACEFAKDSLEGQEYLTPRISPGTYFILNHLGVPLKVLRCEYPTEKALPRFVRQYAAALDAVAIASIDGSLSKAYEYWCSARHQSGHRNRRLTPKRERLFNRYPLCAIDLHSFHINLLETVTGLRRSGL